MRARGRVSSRGKTATVLVLKRTGLAGEGDEDGLFA